MLCRQCNVSATYAMGHCPAGHCPPLPAPQRVLPPENCPHSHLWQSCHGNKGNAGQCVNHLLPTCPLVYLANQNHNTAELNLPCHSNNIAIAYSAIPHPIVHFQNLPITKFTSSRCFTTVAHIFHSLLSLPSFCPAKQWWLVQCAISDGMPAALFPSVTAAATGANLLIC